MAAGLRPLFHTLLSVLHKPKFTRCAHFSCVRGLRISYDCPIITKWRERKVFFYGSLPLLGLLWVIMHSKASWRIQPSLSCVFFFLVTRWPGRENKGRTIFCNNRSVSRRKRSPFLQIVAWDKTSRRFSIEQKHAETILIHFSHHCCLDSQPLFGSFALDEDVPCCSCAVFDVPKRLVGLAQTSFSHLDVSLLFCIFWYQLVKCCFYVVFF